MDAQKVAVDAYKCATTRPPHDVNPSMRCSAADLSTEAINIYSN